MKNIEEEVGTLLQRKGLSLGIVESASGGLISHLITNVPGSSVYYRGSVTAYSNQAKVNLAGVTPEIIEKYGAVSSQVAKEMAMGGRKVLDADICLADTGVAGPGGGTNDKPVGLFYIGLSHKAGTDIRKYNFRGNRRQNKQAAAEAALSWLKEYLLELD